MTPKHEAGDPTAFTSHVQSAAEHLLAVVDGKQKDAFGGNYSQIKEVIGKVHESGYLDQAIVSVLAQLFYYCKTNLHILQETAVVYEETVDVVAEVENVSSVPEVLNHEPLAVQENVLPPLESLTIEARPPMQMEPPLEQQTLPPEQLYYQQPPRPITEMLGTGSFYFLQVIRVYDSYFLGFDDVFFL